MTSAHVFDTVCAVLRSALHNYKRPTCGRTTGQAFELYMRHVTVERFNVTKNCEVGQNSTFCHDTCFSAFEKKKSYVITLVAMLCARMCECTRVHIKTPPRKHTYYLLSALPLFNSVLLV